MNPWGAATPDPYPYFDVHVETFSKKDGRLSLGKDEHVRCDLLPEESAFRLAGLIGMVLAALVFLTFGIPVAAMLRHAGEPHGILLAEPWIRHRWVARMATTLTLAAVGAFASWGLRLRKRWARWTWTAVGGLAIVALVLLARTEDSGLVKHADMSGLICAGVTVLPSIGLILWRLWSNRGQTIFSRDYEAVVARTPHLGLEPGASLWPGVILALAMVVLFWSLNFLVLCTLVEFRVIHTL